MRFYVRYHRLLDMKFLSIVILLALMAWTWTGYKSTADVSVITHVELQNELKNFISGYIEQNVKGYSNIQFVRFWTEPTHTKEIRAVFEYSFDVTDANNESTTTLLKGYAYLTPQEGTGEWSLDKVEINDQVIEFKDGAIVKGDPNGTQESAQPEQTPEHK